MRVTIIDLDWYNKISFLPNPICMKLSSYHKQMRDLINFPKDGFEIKMSYDLMYVVSKQKKIKIPSEINCRDKNVRLFGENFKFLKQYMKDIPDEVAACRADYTLYKLSENNKMANINVVQFFNNGRMLRKIQDFRSSLSGVKNTLIIDKDFWGYKEDDIEICVDMLKDYKNICFEYPIDILKIIKSEKLKKLFYSLNFYTSKDIEFINNATTEEESENVIQFLIEYKEHKPNQAFIPIYFKTKTLPHNIENAAHDLRRCLRIAFIAKQNMVPIFFQAPERIDSPFWFYFEELEAWSIYGFKDSWIEQMTRSTRLRFNCSTERILYDSLKWNTPSINYFLDIARYDLSMIEKYGYLEWGDKYREELDWDKILNNKNYTGGNK